jgi:predicted XRE-type DNA-binding protein
MRNKPKILAQKSSRNIFADLGLPNPEQELLKSLYKIYKIIKQRSLTQARAGAILGIKQPHVSALMRDRAGNFSVGRLIEFLHCARPGCPDHGEANTTVSNVRSRARHLSRCTTA